MMRFFILSSKTPSGVKKAFTRTYLFGCLLLLVALMCKVQADDRISRPNPESSSTSPSTTDQSWTTGIWGSWSSWSACSRTCDRGISTQTRECLQGSGILSNRYRRLRHSRFHGNREPPDDKRCLGVHRRFQLCESPACLFTVDTRKEQCSAFNKKLFDGKLYNWETFPDDPGHCELRCRPAGHRFVATLAKVVEDGTPCSSFGEDRICVAGRCKIVGCDGVIDSSFRFDQCGLCGGRNSTCHRVSGLYARSPLPIGYNLITKIPKGAFNINVTEMNRGRNYLALRLEDGSYVMSSNFSISRSGEYKAAGTIFAYKRKEEQGSGSDSIFAKGPITENLDLMLIYYQRNPGVSYAYSMPLKKQNKQSEPKIVDLKNVSSSPSRRISLPSSTHETNDVSRHQFPPVDKTSLKRTNRIGRTRTPKRSHPDNYEKRSSIPRIRYGSPSDPRIQRPGRTGSRKNVPQPLLATLTQQPSIVKASNVDVLNDVGILNNGRSKSADGKFFWNLAGFGACNQSCGGGFSEAQVKCYSNDRRVLVDDQFCQGLLKPSQPPIACNKFSCPPSWTTSVWSACSVACGEGKQIRKVSCSQRMTSTAFINAPEELCENQESKPLETKECNIKDCNKWHTSPWNQCSANCGKGRRHRKVVCVNQENNVSNDVDCPSPKPLQEEICTLKLCDDSQWMATEWKRCSNLCGLGNQTRRVACMNGNHKVSYESCDRNERPVEIRTCGRQDFTGNGVFKNSNRKNNDLCQRGKWFSGIWEECSSTCGSGSQTREVLCMSRTKGGGWEIDANDGICEGTEKPISKQKCNLSPCEDGEWYTGDWSTCTTSCGNGKQSRKVVCLDSGQADKKCVQDYKPEITQSCNSQPCSDSLQGDVSSSSDHIDAGCTNKWSNCRLVVQARLCLTPHYRDLCCHSCKQTQKSPRWQPRKNQ